MKSEVEYKDLIRNMGSDPFFIHYHSGDQIHLYRSYCRNVSHLKLIIDATGSLVTSFLKFGLYIKKKRFFFMKH